MTAIFLNTNTSYTRYCNICHEMNWNHPLWTVMFCLVVVYLDGVLFCHCESYITSFSSFGSERVAVFSRVWHVFTFILLFSSAVKGQNHFSLCLFYMLMKTPNDKAKISHSSLWYIDFIPSFYLLIIHFNQIFIKLIYLICFGMGNRPLKPLYSYRNRFRVFFFVKHLDMFD